MPGRARPKATMNVITARPNPAYDWQWPVITERHALAQMERSAAHSDDSVYIGFPWATLIDCLGKRRRDRRIKPMGRDLSVLKGDASHWSRRITVCQHIHMLKWIDVFADLGVTDIFWSHKVKGMDFVVARNREIRLHPFPLFPVQYAPDGMDHHGSRSLLYSFVGLAEHPKYLTDVRATIVRVLSEDPRGLVIVRDNWHYERVVYDHQVHGTAKSPKELIDDDASAQYVNSLRNSIFCLCPSGTGPNSIRLWEAIGSGSIPVVMSETYDLPGNPELWKSAVVFCDETEAAVEALPDQLECMTQSAGVLSNKRLALRELWRRYSPDTFVSDVERLCLDEMDLRLG